MRENKFHNYKTYAGFLEALRESLVGDTTIAFIDDKKWIYTHGIYWKCDYSAEEIQQALDEIDGRLNQHTEALDQLKKDLVDLIEQSKLVAEDESLVIRREANGVKAKVNLDESTLGLVNGKVSGKYTMIQLDPDDETLSKRYALSVDGVTPIGSTIDINKDQRLKETFIANSTRENIQGATDKIAKYLAMTFFISDGSEKTEYIDISTFLQDLEAGKGLSIDVSGILNIVPDGSRDTEKFLVIGEDTLGLKGISQAIQDSIISIQGPELRHVRIEKSGGVYTFTEIDIASDSDLRFKKGSGNQSAVLLGTGTEANNQAEVSIGKFNTSSTGAGTGSKTLFSVGNGTGPATRSNALEIRENGDVWINIGGEYKKLQSILGNEIDWYEGN